MWKHGLVGAVLVGSAWAQVTQRVSVGSRGIQANGPTNYLSLAISRDGRYVAFSSSASNLVSGDTNHTDDIFVRDRRTGTTERVSVSSRGEEADAWTVGGISRDGRFVSFSSVSPNLVPGDTNGRQDIFVRDRALGTTERVSVGQGGVQANSNCAGGEMSSDGRYVLFYSWATNLISGGFVTNHVYLRDRLTHVTERVDPAAANDEGYSGGISADGRFVLFQSYATNIVGGDTNWKKDEFVCDRMNHTFERVNVSTGGAQDQSTFSGEEGNCSISADGRFVAFGSSGDNLVPGDSNGEYDVFVRDRLLGITERISVNSSGVGGNDRSLCPSISDDGRFVAFASAATNLVDDDTNGLGDIFVRDRIAGTTERVSISSQGVQGDGDSWSFPAISADGHCVAFVDRARNLVPGDTNQQGDAFVHDSFAGPALVSFCDPTTSGVTHCPCSNPPAGPDQGCDNSSASGGAILSAIGGTYLSSDSLEFQVTGETPNALSLLLQGTALIPSGVVYGQGVRCVGGAITRLHTKRASGGSLTVPDFTAGELTVSGLSEAKGDLIRTGESRYYLVFYRDPIVLGGCPASSTFNATQTGRVTWSP